MELTTVEAKKRHSFNYVEYFETQRYYQCVTCSTVVEPEMGHCRKCVKKLELSDRQQLFCCECRQPINHKRDHFINKKHFVSHYLVNYLTCRCSENLWIPFIETDNPYTGLELRTEDNRHIWTICCAEPSQYNKNEDVYFINCEHQEHDLFLKPYIEFNMDNKAKLSKPKRDEFTGRYYKICSDVISLGIKLGILQELIRDERYFRYMNTELSNRVQEILDFSGIYFNNELISSLLENCFARLRRLFSPDRKDRENTFANYKDHFLKASYPNTHESERKKYGIKKLKVTLKKLIDKSILHDDIGSNSEISIDDCKDLFEFYEEKVLKTIETLNKIHQFELLFNHENSLMPLGLHSTGGEMAQVYLRWGDEALTSYKHKQALELLDFDNLIDKGDLSPDKRKIYERKRDTYERNLISFFRPWIIMDRQTPLNIIAPDGQCIKMPYGFKSMRLAETRDGNYIIYIKTPGINLCPNYRIECFRNNENFARQVFREIKKHRHEQETVDLSDFTYDPSKTML